MKSSVVSSLLFATFISACSGGSSDTNPGLPASTATSAATPMQTPAATPTQTPAATQSQSPAAQVTTVATGFNHPAGVAFDSANDDLYVTDTQNCVIKQVTSTGAVTTVAGSLGTCALQNGTGEAAEFNWPAGIAYDSANGDLYVTDSNNCAIRQITANFAVSTIAGTPTSCAFANGTGTSANFNHPSGIAYDAANDTLYVTDSSNCAVRSLRADGTVSTLAGGVTIIGLQKQGCQFGDGTGAGAYFNNPTGITVDPVSGNLYVSDSTNCSIRQVTTSGVVTTLAGNNVGIDCPAFRDGTGRNAAFALPSGITFDTMTGTLYTTDTNNCDVREITLAGAVTEIAGNNADCGAAATSTDGTGKLARFNFPQFVTYDASNNDLFVTDTNGNALRRLKILAY